MAISFNEIPVDVRVPGHYVEIDNSLALQGPVGMPNRTLAYGQMLPSGTATAGEPVLVTDARQGPTLFGRGSMMAHIVAVALAANPYRPVTALPLADYDGTAATRTVTVTAAPVAAGVLNVYIGGRRSRITVAADDTAANVASALADAINADQDGHVGAAAEDAVITLNAVHKGSDAGDIDVRHSLYDGESMPPGMALTIGELTPGAGNPDIQPAIDSLADSWFQTIIMPWTDTANLLALEADLADRWGADRMIEGHAFSAKRGTVSELATFGESRNSPHVTMADAGITIAPAFMLAAADAALDAGESDPARPRQTLALPSTVRPVPETERREWREHNTLLHAGIATHKVDAAGVVRVERFVTMYQENAAGLPDESYLDVELMRTVMYMRYSYRHRIATKYPRHKLADNGTPIAPGQAIITPNIAKAEQISLFQDWMEMGIAEDLPQFKRDSFVERSLQDRDRLNAIVPPNCINQFRVLAAKLQFRK